MAFATCVATAVERRRPLPAHGMVPDPIFTATHAITIDAPPEKVWPWVAQMGAGRAGWYSWDLIDNGGTPSARRVVPELQTVVAGDIMPAVPGATDAIVRGQASSQWIDRARTPPPAGYDRIFVERAYAVLARLPRPLLVAFARVGHRIMEARHVRGIQRRSTAGTRVEAPSNDGAGESDMRRDRGAL